MDRLAQDLRYALRSLSRQSGWTATICLTLAIGIGATTAIFSLIDAVLLSPLDFPDPDAIVVLYERKIESGVMQRMSPPTFRDWRQDNEVFTEMSAMAPTTFILRGEVARGIGGVQVTPGFFRMLGVDAARGQTFSTAHEMPGSDDVAVVSHGFWQDHLGGTDDAVGTRVELSNRFYTVIGVLPEGFQLYRPSQVFTPLTFTEDKLTDAMRGARYLDVMARLEPGLTVDEATSAMDVLTARLGRTYPQSRGYDAAMVPWHEQLVGTSRPALLLLMAAVALFLVVGCANVAHLLLARTVSRRHEMAIRGALGAPHGRLVSQLLTESLALALPSGALGLLFAAWCRDLLVRYVPWSTPRLDESAIEGRVIFFTVGLSLATGLLSGMASAWVGSRARLQGTLASDGRGETAGSQRLRYGLIVAETALSLVILVGSGLLLRSFVALSAVDPGFRAENTAAAWVGMPSARYGEDAQRRVLANAVLEQLRAHPGVESAALVTNLPMSANTMSFGFGLPDRPRADGEPERQGQYHAASPDYFRTLGIPLLRGRSFSVHDRADAPPVAIVNQAAAELYWPDGDPLGERVTIYYDGVEREIVGVVGNVRHFGLDTAPGGELYVPYEQNPWLFAHMVAHGDPKSLPTAMREALRAADPELPFDAFYQLDAQLSERLKLPFFQTTLLLAFGAAALALSVLGLYGVVAYSFHRRTREVAVRMALGAERRHISWQFLRQGLCLTLAGLVLGTIAALWLTRFVEGFLYGIGPHDPVTFGVIALLVAGVGVLAAWRPAHRAAAMNPMVALRRE